MLVFNVRDYGANPNDSIDDTKAIQAALDAAKAAGGGHVALDAGTYIISGGKEASDGALRIYSNTEISGTGMGETVLKLADGWSTKITGLIRTPVNEVTTDVVIRDLTLDGNRANTTADVDGIMTGVLPGKDAYDDRILIERVEIHDVSRIAFNPHEQTHNLTIRDCVAHNNSWDGFIADYVVNAVYENNVAYANDRHGFNVVTHSHDVVLRNNVSYDNAENGIVVQRGAGSQTISGWQNMLNYNVLVEGNTVYNNGTNGILFKQAENSQIINNIIYGNAADGIQLEGANEIIVDGNQIQSSAVNGIEIRPYTGSLGGPGNSYSNIIINNVITAVQKAFVESGATTLNNTYAENFIGSLGVSLGASAKIVGDSATFVYQELSFTVTLPKGFVEPGTPVNDNPVGVDDVFTGDQDKPVTGNLLTNDTDANGDALTVVAGTFATTNGTVIINADGTFTYTPKAGFFGADTFEYTVQDSKGGTDKAMLSMTIKQVIPPTPDPQPVITATTNVVSGDSLDNVINGSGKDDVIRGQGGNDRLYGGSGNDYIEGNDGNDRIHGGMGKDVVKGGAGKDSFAFINYAEAGQGDVIADFNVADDKIDVSQMVKDFVGFVRTSSFADGFFKVVQNGANLDLYIDKDGSAGSTQATLLVTINNIKSSDFTLANLVTPDVGLPSPVTTTPTPTPTPTPTIDKAVSITGTADSDILAGGNANDTLKGAAGNDKLIGKEGNDTLWGNDGNDVLYGGSGSDWMKGGDGTDRFIVDANLGGVDTIDDFRTGSGDKLEIRNLLSFDAAHDAIADFIKFTTSGTNTIVSVDLNGKTDGGNFVDIAKITGITGLDAAKLYSDGHLVFVNSDTV